MTKVATPEPVAWASKDLRRVFAETEMQILEHEGGSRETQIRAFPVSLITTDQAEAYKDACVREALEWQPIETAPKDGTHVHLFAPELQFVGFYAAAGWCYVAPRCPEAPTQPTHWMPLPAPPHQ